MPEQSEVYRRHADVYERLVQREDYQSNVLPALEAIRLFDGLDVVEFGTGTGRFALMLAPVVRRLLAFDTSQHMLRLTHAKLRQTDLKNWQLSVGDNRCLPLPADCADLALAGWTFGHATEWYADRWRDAIERSLAEMRRVLRTGGTAVILETLTTGSEEPHPPTDTLAAYYDMLESEYRFSHTWIRTDYQFESVAEADELLRFFFGDQLADRAVLEKAAVVPECTGLWWLEV